MKHIASKMILALCGITAMLVLATGIAFIPANALDNGIYLAVATPHYQHPTTGMIEDSGGEKSKVLGQSMTESALHNEALVEVDPAGNTYITVRLNLMDNIEHPAFSVDTARNGSFTDVSSSVMQEDFTANTTDFRMQVANENVILRCAMYVVPMGRDVVFYITVSDLKQGSGDFVTSVKVNAPVAEPSKPAETSKPQESSKPAQTSKPQESSKPAQTSKPEESSTPVEPPKPQESSAPTEVSQTVSSTPESSVSSEASKQSKPEKTSEPSKNSEVSQKSEPTESSAASKAEETTSAVSEPSGQSSQAESSEILQSSDSTETVGLTEFDAQGSKVKETSDNANAADGSNVAIWVIIGIAVVAAVGIIVFIILRKGKGAK